MSAGPWDLGVTTGPFSQGDYRLLERRLRVLFFATILSFIGNRSQDQGQEKRELPE